MPQRSIVFVPPTPDLPARFGTLLFAAIAFACATVQPALTAAPPDPLSASASQERETADEFGKRYHCKPGPWGDLEYYYIYLEAPDRVVNHMVRPDPTPEWCFPGATEESIRALFDRAGMSPALQDYLLDPGRLVSEDDVLKVYPPLPDLLAMTPEQRTIIYTELARSELNILHVYPATIFHGDVDAWLARSGLRPELGEAVKKMSYMRGGMLCFSDVAAILAMVESEAEAHSFMKTMSRTRSLVLQLNVRTSADWEAAQLYWSASGLNEDIASVIFPADAEGGGIGRFDCVHLLPALPRRNLYTYPSEALTMSARLPDCYWTSFNFFSSSPLNYHTDSRLFELNLMENYTRVEPPYAFGDVLMFLARDGLPRHSCVYVADDIVYTKNGRNRGSPWILSKIDDMDRRYSYDGRVTLQAFRRNADRGGHLDGASAAGQ